MKVDSKSSECLVDLQDASIVCLKMDVSAGRRLHEQHSLMDVQLPEAGEFQKSVRWNECI